jgi:hypothetical protein
MDNKARVPPNLTAFTVPTIMTEAWFPQLGVHCVFNPCSHGKRPVYRWTMSWRLKGVDEGSGEGAAGHACHTPESEALSSSA